MQKNILITCFNGKNNSSYELLNIINDDYIDKLVLTNSFITSEKQLKKQIDNNNYKYIISFGQKPKCSKIYVELYGIKNNETIETKLIYKDLILLFKENNIRYVISKNAGNYLCNNIYYEGMKYINNNNLNIKMLFIHIPSLKSGYDFEKLGNVLSKYFIILNNDINSSSCNDNI